MRNTGNTLRLGRLRTLAAGLALLLASTNLSAVVANEIKHGDLIIAHAWSRATPSGAKVGAGYVEITNTGSTADRLISATSDIAGRVEVHTMAIDNGVMRMRRVDGGLALPPGKTVKLEPGGLHLMFMKLGDGLKKGVPFKAKLNFEKAGEIELTFMVEAIGGKPHRGHGKKH